jgi:hypothetical protein
VNNKGHVHIRVSCDQQLLIVYKQISYGQIVYQLFKTSWNFNLIWPSHVTEISITRQLMLFIIMAASFTYNLIKLVLGPMEIFFIWYSWNIVEIGIKTPKIKNENQIMTETLKLLICTGQNIQRFQVLLFSFINLYTHKGNG